MVTNTFKHQFSHLLPIILLMLCAQVFAAEGLQHEVQSGDTLFSLARRYDVSVSELRQLNNLDEDSRIFIGQKLQLPARYTIYTVERGDTLFGLARQFDSSVSELRDLNRLSESDVLRIGQELKIPANTTDDGTSTVATGSDDAPSEKTAEDIIDSISSDSAIITSPDQRGNIEDGDRIWPHDGTRTEADGKFPGVYITGREGDPVLSVSSGRVIYSGPHTAFGHVVFVQSSSGYIYVYGGNASPDVTIGQQVRPGAQIGAIGGNSFTKSNAVFFSVWKDNQFLEPEAAPRS
ncbi:MAG: LysM peptidoglycan-binding domain-containing protein [Spirochaeta sp.]